MAIIQEEDCRRFVEHEGWRYTSEDLPSVGTEVEVSDYTGIDDHHWADITWSADTPSGMALLSQVPADWRW